MTDASAKIVRRTCSKCNNVRETPDVICPDCGNFLQSVNRIRLIGAFLVIVGVALFGFMIWLALWMLNAAAQTGKSNYYGSPGQTAFLIFVFGLVILVSLNAAAGGVWQIVFGRRNKLLMITMAIWVFGFLAAGFAAFLSK